MQRGPTTLPAPPPPPRATEASRRPWELVHQRNRKPGLVGGGGGEGGVCGEETCEGEVRGRASGSGA